VVQNFSKALRIGFISFNLSSLRGLYRVIESAQRKRSNLQQPLSKLLKLKEMNPILKAVLDFNNEIILLFETVNYIFGCNVDAKT